MRVLVAPDKFAGTLTAVEAAEAIGTGWHRRSPADEVRHLPMADGGPGFCDVLHASLGGEHVALSVSGPSGAAVRATLLVVAETAYVESAQACGRHLMAGAHRDVERATTAGVGELICAAVDAGAQHIVVGLGGSGTHDGGAGMLAALGATAEPPQALTTGPNGLGSLTDVDLSAARDRLAGVRVVAATDVHNPLLGLRGATNVYGPQKGIAEDRIHAVDAALERLADATDRRLADTKGAGAAGGLGFALLLLGAARVAGFDVVADAVGLREAAGACDLVITGEGTFDYSSRSGKVVAGVARIAGQALQPCIVLAGQVLVGSREMRTMGIEAAYAVADLVGRDVAFARPGDSLASLAERVARTWSF